MAVLAVLGAMAGCGGGGSSTTVGLSVIPVDQRQAAPAVTGTLLGGGSYDLSEHLGEVVVLNFWGSWCPPCNVEADDLEGTYQDTQASGVSFIGVDMRDSESKGLAFQSANSTYPSIFDPEGRVVLAFTIPPSAIPSTVIFDRQGRIAVIAETAVLKENLEPVVQQVAAESA